MESKNAELLKELVKDHVVRECVEVATLTSTDVLKEQAAAQWTREDVFEPSTSETPMEIDPKDTNAFPEPEPVASEQAHAFQIKPNKVKNSKIP